MYVIHLYSNVISPTALKYRHLLKLNLVATADPR